MNDRQRLNIAEPVPLLRARRSALAREIELAKQKTKSLQAGIDQRQKALARLDAQLYLSSAGPASASVAG